MLLVGIFGSGFFVLTGQQPTQSRVFTSAQAEAGRATYERTCGKCHTPSLLGRNGDKGELPPISSLPAPYQKFIGSRGFVPPLAGRVFLERWGGKTAAELIARFQITADDPYFQFEGMNGRGYRQHNRIRPRGEWRQSRCAAINPDHRWHR